eukprot:s85_g17.t1
MAPILHWAAGVGAAISIKVSSSIDDVVWLAPFLTNNVSKLSRINNTAIYVSVCVVQTMLAMCIAYSGNKIVEYITRNAKDAWSSEKILTVLAGSMLAIYSVKLLHEWWTENYAKVSPDTVDTDLEDGELTPMYRKPEHGDSSNEIDIQSKAASQKESAQTQTLFVIAFIGSLDDLTLFVPMLVGKGFDFAQLLIGALTAAGLIVTICLFVGLCQPVADCISRVPLFAIVVGFATLLLAKSFTME